MAKKYYVKTGQRHVRQVWEVHIPHKLRTAYKRYATALAIYQSYAGDHETKASLKKSVDRELYNVYKIAFGGEA